MNKVRMNPKDNQSVFDFVITALVEQGRPSVTSGGACMYRGPDGTKCAAGHCIPDDKYDSWMEGSTVVGYAFFFKQLGLDLHFLEKLQLCHDDPTLGWDRDRDIWLCDMLHAARNLAGAFNLSTEVVDLAEAQLAEEGDTEPLDAVFSND